MENLEKENVRQLIISTNPDMIELGLMLNDKFKYFVQTWRFYRKYKRSKFWINSRKYTVDTTEERFNKLSVILQNELKHYSPVFWLDYADYKIRLPWVHWQYQISSGLPSQFRSCTNYKFHPYTDMFKTSYR